MWASIVLIVFLAAPGQVTWKEVWVDIDACGKTVQMGPMVLNVEAMEVAKWKREHKGWTVVGRSCLMGRLA